MQQRITFVHKPSDAIDPKSIKVADSSISFSGLKAVREDRITLNLEELPSDIRHVLEQTHELHIRYVKSAQHSSVIPFLSRLSSGIHIFYTPRADTRKDDATNFTSTKLCQSLRTILGIKNDDLCLSTEQSFTRLPSQRFQHSATFSYYLSEDQITASSIARYMLSTCRADSRLCREQLYLLSKAISSDISYSAISDTLVTTIMSPLQTWDMNTTKDSGRLEFGLLSNEPAFEPEHLSMGGFLAVVGEDTKPSPVHFTFPSRHHPHSSVYSTTLQRPIGLHPSLQITISDLTYPQDSESCTLHSYLTLPKHVFVDKYQFNDALFLASKNITAIHYLSHDVDLEAPAYTVTLWGASMLLELFTPPSEKLETAQHYSAEIPLHLRYMLPASGTSYHNATMPEPVVFWACKGAEGSKYSVNPFDRVHLGYDGLFGPRTSFHHLNLGLTSGDGGYLSFEIPIMDRQWARTIEVGTACVVLLGFLWVLLKLGLVASNTGVGRGARTTLQASGKKNN